MGAAMARNANRSRGAVSPAVLLASSLAGCGVPADADSFSAARASMVRDLETGRVGLLGSGRAPIRDPEVLAAMGEVRRHLFVPEWVRASAYEDHPLPIGHDQTISQPFVVAFMTEALRLKPTDEVLEIGTGSGYQAAVLAKIAKQVYTIEIVEPLGRQAAKVLDELGYRNVEVRIGDGYRGWPEHAPFDAIILTAAPDRVPEPLVEQLAVGGRLLAPVGSGYQELVLLEKTEEGVVRRSLLPVRFVPMTGEAQRR